MWYLRKLVSCLLIASAPLLGVTGFDQGAFLCWGDGGHVGIEVDSCDTRCETPSFTEDFSLYTGCREDDDACGSCIDIPLPAGWATKRVADSGRRSVLPSAAVCAAYRAAGSLTDREADRRYWRLRRSSCDYKPTEPIGTVVLLI